MFAAPFVKIRDGRLLLRPDCHSQRPDPDLLNGFNPHGVIFGVGRIQEEGPLYLVPIRFESSPPMKMGWRMSLRSSRTASRRSISALMDDKKRESVDS